MKPLSEKVTKQICCKCGVTDLEVFNRKDVAEAVKRLKEEVEDNNLFNNRKHSWWSLIDEIFGEFKDTDNREKAKQ